MRDIPARMEDRLIVALDVHSVDEAWAMVERLPMVSFFKVGLGLLYARGFDELLDRLIRRGRVFLDAKMFDIPETVRRGVEVAAQRGVSLITVHGDEAIMRAAVQGKAGTDVRIFAVTVLTSLDDAALGRMGYRHSARELVLARAKAAAEAGCDGIIASALDHPDAIRAEVRAPGLLIATPGIRSARDAMNDHKRAATPEQAIRDGADYLVVGRPIIGARAPGEAADGIIREMKGER